MRKRVYIALTVLLVILAGVIAWQVLQMPEREPVYQGRRLTSWLKPIIGKSFYDDPQVLKADEALRQIGTNAIPTLLRMLRVKDSPLKVKLMDLTKRQRIIEIRYTTARDVNFRAFCAFSVLGAKAQSAVPTLIEIANQNISPESQGDSIFALGSIGPPAKEAVPSLLGWATNANAYVRFHAISALGKIGTEPDRVVPVLANALHDPDYYVRFHAVLALGKFGPNAKLAVPALVEFLNAPQRNSLDRRVIADALKAIDPEAAAKAGVK
ncbi:MAG: HEAT repeat domain-containing protein [Limisphaerales bacterium]